MRLRYPAYMCTESVSVGVDAMHVPATCTPRQATCTSLHLSGAVRRQKALRAKLDALRERRAALRPEEGDCEDASWRLGIDEESEREAWLAQLELDSIHVSGHACLALQSLDVESAWQISLCPS